MRHSKVVALVLLTLTACVGEPADDAPADLDAGALFDAALWQPPHIDLPTPDAGDVWLSRFGLYEDIDDKRVARDLRAFEPAHALWSDGADKRRWLRLPAGTQIDTRDMDHWQFPVGTVAYKEFTRGGKRLETRVIVRTGASPEAVWMGAFVWREDERDALLARDGATNVRGTTHDVPSQKLCGVCHNGEPGRLLGFSAVQQPRAATTLLTQPPAQPYVVPGDPTAVAALGYLHANCGSCHNPGGSARPDTDMDLRLRVADRELATTTIFRATVRQKLQYFTSAPQVERVAPGLPEASGLWFRMSERGPNTQMPPLASEQVDAHGLALVRAWIAALPP